MPKRSTALPASGVENSWDRYQNRVDPESEEVVVARYTGAISAVVVEEP